MVICLVTGTGMDCRRTAGFILREVLFLYVCRHTEGYGLGAWRKPTLIWIEFSG